MGLQHIVPRLEADIRASVRADAFGHLAPKKHKEYPVRYVWSVGVYGNACHNPTVIIAEGDLPNSPWEYDAVHDLIAALGKDAKRGTFASGCVYEFDGLFCNYCFSGVVQKLADYNRPLVDSRPVFRARTVKVDLTATLKQQQDAC
jgi:hypothetical protein